MWAFVLWDVTVTMGNVLLRGKVFRGHDRQRRSGRPGQPARVARRGGMNVTLILILIIPILLASAGSLFLYPGNPLVLAAFHLSFLSLAALVTYRPRIDAYFFLAGFMLLGFWLKFMVHLYFDYTFVEPVGAFDYSPGQWDTALSAAAAAAAGVALFRIEHLLAPRRILAKAPLSVGPHWYRRRPVRTWAVAIVLTLALYLVNYRFAFFQTGVNPKVTLPPGMNAMLAWTVYAGAPLAWALLTEWELARRPDRFAPEVWGVCLFAIVASVSMASRATAAFLFAAYAGAVVLHMPATLKRPLHRRRWRLALMLITALVLSLTLVSVFRMSTYVVEDEHVGQDRRLVKTPEANLTKHEVVRQILRLPVDRWVGLEGVLSVSGSPERSLSLLVAGIRESPESGVDSIYQKLSGSPYAYQSDFIYLTLPGAPAIFFYSGSLLIVLAGMYFLTAVLTAVEMVAAKVTGSRFLVAVLGLLMANAVSQMSFPYLWLAFVVETVIALYAFAILRHLPQFLGRGGGRSTPA